MFMCPGIQRAEGHFGFDWVTHRGDPLPANTDMGFTVALPEGFPVNNNRDRMDRVEALSGWKFNDILHGDDRATLGVVDFERDLTDHELDQSGHRPHQRARRDPSRSARRRSRVATSSWEVTAPTSSRVVAATTSSTVTVGSTPSCRSKPRVPQYPGDTNVVQRRVTHCGASTRGTGTQPRRHQHRPVDQDAASRHDRRVHRRSGVLRCRGSVRHPPERQRVRDGDAHQTRSHSRHRRHRHAVEHRDRSLHLYDVPNRGLSINFGLLFNTAATGTVNITRTPPVEDQLLTACPGRERRRRLPPPGPHLDSHIRGRRRLAVARSERQHVHAG